MGMFDDIQTDGLEAPEDRLGRFQLFETDIYLAKIKVAYVQAQPDSKSKAIQLIATIDGKDYRELLWVTGKDGRNWFENKEDKSKHIALPGFQIVDDICMMTTEKNLKGQVIEEKVVNVYDFDQRKELPKKVPVLVELIDKEVFLGIQKQLVNKQAKNTSTGAYEDTPETREQNTINKVFHNPSMLTIAEASNKKPAEFHAQWLERNKGNTIDRRKIKSGGDGAGRSGPPQAGNQKSPTSSLFQK